MSRNSLRLLAILISLTFAPGCEFLYRSKPGLVYEFPTGFLGAPFLSLLPGGNGVVDCLPGEDETDFGLAWRYQDPSADVQVVRPEAVMDGLLETVLTVRQFVLAGVALIGAATLATIVLVFVLSARLRRREILTMTRIGAPPGRVAAILGAEVLLVLAASAGLAGLLTAVAAFFGDEIFLALLLSGA